MADPIPFQDTRNSASSRVPVKDPLTAMAPIWYCVGTVPLGDVLDDLFDYLAVCKSSIRDIGPIGSSICGPSSHIKAVGETLPRQHRSEMDKARAVTVDPVTILVPS